MTNPIAPLTFPSAALTPLGATLLKQGIDENLWATFTPQGGGQSIIFYLKGGLSSIAPGVPGLDGIVIQSTSGLTAPFKQVDLQAARQDGVTNNGTVYDPALITLQGEMHAATPQGLDVVRDAWQGMWNPRMTVSLEYITPEAGYWHADARLESTWSDVIKLDRRYMYRPLVHKCRLDNAFWYGVPSTSTFQPSYTTFGDTFTDDSTGALSGDWTVTYSSGHTGSIEITNGVGAVWSDTGNDNQTSIARYNAQSTDTDYQIISVQIGGSFEGLTLGGEAAFDIWGRLDGSGNGVRCHVTDSGVTVSRFNSGTETVMYSTFLIIPPLPGEIWTFYVGVTVGTPRSYSVSRSGFDFFGINFDGHTLFTFSEFGTGSALGSSYRGVGFGMDTAEGITILGVQAPEAVPAPIAGLAAADNVTITQSGFVQLSNIGTEEEGPQYVVTGPGIFGFGDGPGSAPTISLGPLAVGQTAVVTTWPPRLRSVVDAADPTVNLYPLLSGRFQNPIPGVPLPSQAQPVQIPVSITNGSALSKIVATVTPRRIHPA